MDYILDSPGNQRVRQGDLCVIHISEHLRYILKVEHDAQIQTKFGLLKARDLLNHPYGVRFECKKGWILPLRLTPELWTQLLPHRTQILYQADISMILLQLDIKPGTIVAESGTGSGSLSHAILRACLPNGFLHTFEINKSRFTEAQREFKEHGFEGRFKVYNQDVCEMGFAPELSNQVDAVILDLPRTWEAIEHAYKILRPDGSRLCTFSPCIEQVQQNVAQMNRLKLKDIVTIECLMKPYDIRVQKLRVWNEDILNALVSIEKKRFDNLKSKLESNKKAKILESENSDDESKEAELDLINCETEDDSLQQLRTAMSDPKAPFNSDMLPKNSHIHAKQFNESVGHSGYLTFASKRP